MQNTFSITFILTGLYLFVLVSSCKETIDSKKHYDSTASFLNSFTEEAQSTPEVFYEDTSVLRDPSQALAFGNYLIVEDRSDTDICVVIDLKSNKAIKRFLRIGNGPNEFLYPRLSKIGKDSLFVFESEKQKYYKYGIENIVNEDVTPASTGRLKLQYDSEYCSNVFLNKQQLLTRGIFNQERFEVLSSSGDFLYAFGEYPEAESMLDQNNRHLGYVFSASGGDLCINSYSNRILTTHSFGIELIEFTPNTAASSVLKGYYWFTPKILGAETDKNRLTVFQTGEGFTIGAEYCVAIGKYIFTNFSTYTFNDLQKTAMPDYRNYILVFDWDGNPICKIKLTSNIGISFSLAPNGKAFLSTQVDPEEGYKRIVSIPIPDKFLN